MKRVGITAFLSFCAIACSKMAPSPGLVNTQELGTVRGYHLERVITHIHTPYSNDACDSNGMNADGTLNLECLHDLKRALCENHINLSFSTDHVDHMAQQDFENLLLLESGESVITNASGDRVASSIPCKDGFNVVMAPGLEGKLLALGMEKHITGTVEDREAVYGGDGASDKTTLESSIASGGSNALVAIPHTESRSLDLLRTLNPSAIEIYNLHANLDPKIRKASLGFKPFEHVAKFMNYLMDFFNTQNADYLFVEYFQMSPVYFSKWNTLLAEGVSVTGLAAHDSHENVFPQKASDGERLDQHRRMTRMFSNLVMTTTTGIDAIKTAIRDGKVYFVLEGLGSPVGLDFHADVNGSVVEMGSIAPIGAGGTSIVFQQPTVLSSFPGMDSDESPEIISELHFIDSTGAESVVARSTERTLVYANPPAGHYRVHVMMKPLHLEDFVIKDDYVERYYPWIITNPIKVVP
jgi:hypothetical protein